MPLQNVFLFLHLFAVLLLHISDLSLVMLNLKLMDFNSLYFEIELLFKHRHICLYLIVLSY